MAQVFQDGIGISNVHERLRVLYGADFRMDISSQEGAGTRIRIEIPELVPTASESSIIFPATKEFKVGQASACLLLTWVQHANIQNQTG